MTLSFVITGGLLHLDDEGTRCETAMLLTFLLFDEVASIQMQ